MSLCRFDYAVMAIEDLQKYLDTSAAEINTRLMVKRIAEAVHKLESIEDDIEPLSSKLDKQKALSSALAELKENLAELKPEMKPMQEFMKLHSRDLKSLVELGSIAKSFELTARITLSIDKRVRERVKRASSQINSYAPTKGTATIEARAANPSQATGKRHAAKVKKGGDI